MQDNLVIIGAGQVAAQALESLRRGGYTGRVVIVGDETEPPYQRPPLSKKFLAGELPVERLYMKPAAFYAQPDTELRLGVRAERLDLAHKTLSLSDGTELGYQRLLLATGTAARKITVPGSDLAGVHYLRSIADVDRIRAELPAAKHVVIIGGGYIGLEVAATCRQLGKDVAVLEMADRVMNRVVAPEISSFYTEEHAKHGVHIHTQTLVSALRASASNPNHVAAVETLGGGSFPADLVVVGIGVVPVTSLAASAGIACENGIAVDEYCRTSAPDVFAAGDCANHPSIRYGRRIRLESVDNAFEQAKTAATNMLGGSQIHDRIPWFWSDQYDLKLLIVGLNFDYDHVVLRGDPGSRSFSCCYLRGQELLAIDCINNPKDYMVAKKLIPERKHCDLVKLSDAGLPLKDTVI
jgi:3-phenylpropionate/trans-cinnamate dioxygenase ferredoxin reductase subunit